MRAEDDFRLPRSVVPRHYELTMEPSLDDFTFAGSAVIDVEIVEPVTEVAVNAVDLVIESGELVRSDGGVLVRTVPEYWPDEERVILRLDGVAEPGPWRLRLQWTGELNDQLRGFYRSTYAAESGERRVLATTQFASTHARRALPCWDEPDLKATFGVTLVVDEGLTAISNQPEIARAETGDGRVEVSFAETMVMPVYLLTFIVGELEATAPVDVDGTPLRIVHRPGQGHLTAFAVEAAAHGLRYFAEYYSIPYPGDKLDMIAIPDFAWGAMENLGAITYRESTLLVDPDTASLAEIAGVAGVVHHELAHMWFGDLVTMRWWDGVWLNEAFAALMGVKADEDFRPDWMPWLYFSADRAAAMEIDALTTTRPVEFPVASPEESHAMYDVLTYDKGAAVLRMLEQYLGEEVFRAGVSAYLKKHAYGNTVTGDLWNALEAASGQPVGEIMYPWIYQGGFPQLHVSQVGGRYHIDQEQFRYVGVGDGNWPVPLLYRTASGGRRLLLDEPAVLDAESTVVLNAGGHGFYSVKYDGPLLSRLVAELSGLDVAERYGLVKDVWSGVLAGAADVGDFLDLASTLRDETEPLVWNAVLSAVDEIRHVASSDDLPALESYVRNLLSNAADRLGWTPRQGEPERVRQWRGDMLRALGVMGADPATAAQARTVLARSHSDADAVDANVSAAALSIVAATGDMDDYGSFVERFRTARTPQEVNRYRRALTAVPEAEAAARTLGMVLDGSVRRQDSTSTLALLLGHRDTGAGTWERIKARWEDLVAAMDPGNEWRMLDLVYYRSERGVAADIAEWLSANPLPSTDRHVAQQLERLEIRVALRRRLGRELSQTLQL